MEPKTYVHKPTEVEALQVHDAEGNLNGIQEFIGDAGTFETNPKDSSSYILHTEGEGDRTVVGSDYIIKGVLGKIYPCSQGVFEESYDVKE